MEANDLKIYPLVRSDEENVREMLHDASLRGEVYRIARELIKESIIKLGLGIEWLKNPQSNIVIISPHAQAGLRKYDIQKTTQESMINDVTPSWEQYDRISKVVGQAKRSDGNESTGFGDSFAKQFAFEVMLGIKELTGSLPNYVGARFTQTSADANSGVSAKSMKIIKQSDLPDDVIEFLDQINFADVQAIRQSKFDFILNNIKPELQEINIKMINEVRSISGNKDILEKIKNRYAEIRLKFRKQVSAFSALLMINKFRSKVIELGAHSSEDKLILNLHTALDRNPKKEGNPELEIILGTRHGLSVNNFDVEVALARFLKNRGFNVFETSLIPLPAEGAELGGLQSRDNLPGEEERFQQFNAWAQERNITANEFTPDRNLEVTGRLRGTEIGKNLREAIETTGTKVNIIQVEVVRNLFGNEERRLLLARSIAEFSVHYDNYTKIIDRQVDFITYLEQQNIMGN